MLVRKMPGASYAVAVAVGAIEVVVSVIVAFLYSSHVANAGTFDFVSRHVVSAPLGLAYDVALDGSAC